MLMTLLYNMNTFTDKDESTPSRLKMIPTTGRKVPTLVKNKIINATTFAGLINHRNTSDLVPFATEMNQLCRGGNPIFKNKTTGTRGNKELMTPNKYNQDEIS